MTAPAPAHSRDFGVYIHVPFCSVRCGYCDFNTYAPGEVQGATREGYVEAALREMSLGRAVMQGRAKPANTVFFGGGTPTMLDPRALITLLDGVKTHWGLEPGAEVTTEANPDSVSVKSLAALASAGFTRVSFGMQSAVPHVLATLERTHNPDNVVRAVQWAREAGLSVSLDLIYGTPGESMADWMASVEAAIAAQPDHLSAYSLVIEPGTKMGAQFKRGLIPATDPDLQAHMYEAADDAFVAAGFHNYEISNWALGEAQRCKHNIAYWTSQDWWGVGPGAHSYLGPGKDCEGLEVPARRWWNVKHPLAYSQRLEAGLSPEQQGEELSGEDLDLEAVMLQVRLREGVPLSLVKEDRRDKVAGLLAAGLIEGAPVFAPQPRIVLTRKGRLLADSVVRDLT